MKSRTWLRSLGPQGRLKVDFSNARCDRGGCPEFLNRRRGTIATESGIWFLERDDATVDAIRHLLRTGPIRHEVLVNEQLSFVEIHRRFLA
jgi:hypothetical protein